MYGTGRSVLHSLDSYLAGRQLQLISVVGAALRELKIEHVVLQGTAHRSLLFIIFKLHQRSKSRDGNMLLYADDITLVTIGAQFDRLQTDSDILFEGVRERFQLNKMCINYSKTQHHLL